MILFFNNNVQEIQNNPNSDNTNLQDNFSFIYNIMKNLITNLYVEKQINPNTEKASKI